VTPAPSSAYVHVPFCRKRCAYCDFTTYAGLLHLVGPYFDAVRTEISAERVRAGNRGFVPPLATVYFGGGTPSLVPEAELAGTMRALEDAFGVTPDMEATLEVNPGTLRPGAPEAWRRCGFNRASVGVQALRDPLLSALGRIHTALEAEEAFAALRRAGFENLSADLMLGLPGQTERDVVEAVDRVVSYGARHVSFYSLTVESGTPFALRYPEGRGLPGDEEERRLYDAALAALSRNGLEQYEISSTARPGWQCRHTLVYWEARPYYGFGAGAHAYTDGIRRGNLRGVAQYVASIARTGSAEESRETVDRQGEMAEVMFLGLRMNEGISREAFSKRFGCWPEDVFGEAVASLVRDGLLACRDGWIRPTRKGIDFSNVVSRAFL
jgi:oxygen-independent coproporphyrinogen III oxidase